MKPEGKLISYCGICCSLCPSYRSEKCPGCTKLRGCRITQCAKSRKKRYCFSCGEFPCRLFEEGFEWNLNKFPSLKKFRMGTVKWKPYSREFIRLFRTGKKLSKK